MSTRLIARLNRGVAVGLAASLTALGVTAVAPAASAATIDYSCQRSGPVVAVDIDSDAPATMYVGETFTPTFTMVYPIPDSDRAAMYASGWRSLDGFIEVHGDVNGIPVIPFANLTVTPRDVPAAGALPVTAVGKGAPLVATVPGDLEIHAGDFYTGLKFYTANGGFGSSQRRQDVCTLPPGQNPVIDKVVVASRSSTALALSPTSSPYGETVIATAKVTTPGGSPDGSVNFVVDGVARKATHMTKDGTAGMVLGTLAAGDHTISAAFVPKDAVHYVASSSAPQTLKVGKAATRIRVAIDGKRTDRATKVTAKVKAAFGTEPTGKVRFVLRTLTGRTIMWLKVRRLSGAQASVGFGKLPKARYKLVAKYLGDSNHLRSTTIKKFRVKRPR